MRSILLLFVFLGWPALAMATLASAQLASSRLGEETWSRVLQIENLRPDSKYPSTVYAFVFEFAGILWFYTDTDGTQSLSLHVNRLEREKADLAPLLKAIDPGFLVFSVVPETKQARPANLVLPNGCFIESVLAVRAREAQGESIKRAELVMYFTRYLKSGHCILAYETPKGVFWLDPVHDPKPRRFGRSWPDQPTKLAAASWTDGRADQISKVRVLPLAVDRGLDRNPSQLAKTSGVRSPLG